MQEEINALTSRVEALERNSQDRYNIQPQDLGVFGGKVDMRDILNTIRIASDSTALAAYLAQKPTDFYNQIFVDNTQDGITTKDRLYIYDTQAQSWRYCEFI